MNKRLNTQAQGGFTLIELIVVIVILGILAATALPKFADLSGDARFANVNAAKGAMASAAAVVHGQALVKSTTGTISMEGVSVTLSTGQYPTTGSIAAAAGIDTNADYKTYTAGGTAVPATLTSPAVPVNSIVLVPMSIANTATSVNCFATYTLDSASSNAPAISVTGSAAACK